MNITDTMRGFFVGFNLTTDDILSDKFSSLQFLVYSKNHSITSCALIKMFS